MTIDINKSVWKDWKRKCRKPQQRQKARGKSQFGFVEGYKLAFYMAFCICRDAAPSPGLQFSPMENPVHPAKQGCNRKSGWTFNDQVSSLKRHLFICVVQKWCMHVISVLGWSEYLKQDLSSSPKIPWKVWKWHSREQTATFFRPCSTWKTLTFLGFYKYN